MINFLTWFSAQDEKFWIPAVALSCLLAAFVIILKYGLGEEEVFAEEVPRNTRKEDLARWLRGEICLDEYLELHRETADDGSLSKPEVTPVYLNPVPVFSECPTTAHRGQRIHRSRIRNTSLKGTEVYQPSTKSWICPDQIAWKWYPCCQSVFVWVEEVNGRSL